MIHREDPLQRIEDRLRSGLFIIYNPLLFRLFSLQHELVERFRDLLISRCLVCPSFFDRLEAFGVGHRGSFTLVCDCVLQVSFGHDRF